MSEGHSLIHIPTSVEEFLPPKPSDLITEAANFLRSHWGEVRPFYEVISGAAPSTHGSLAFDEAAAAFEIKEIIRSNGFAQLGTVTTAQMWKALRYGFKRNTGTTVHELEKQNRRLAIEQRTAETEAPAAAD